MAAAIIFDVVGVGSGAEGRFFQRRHGGVR